MKKLLFLLLVIFATAASASAKGGAWDRNKDKEKEKEGEKAASTKPGNNEHTEKAVTSPKITKPSRVEEYVWMLPREQEGERVNEAELQKAIVDLYKWYLQNESRINNNELLKINGKELVFPFKVDVKTLQQYFQFVKNNFPGLSEDDLTSECDKKPAANRKKYAPVTVRDDMESPMTIPVNR